MGTTFVTPAVTLMQKTVTPCGATAFSFFNDSVGARGRTRTCDFYRVKVAL